jgi:hypothetical protein
VLLAKMEDATAASSFGSLLCETKFDCRALTGASLHLPREKRCRGIKRSTPRAALVYFCELHLAVATRALAKTPTACFAGICPKAPTYRSTVRLSTLSGKSAISSAVGGSYNVLRAQLECREGNVAAIAARGYDAPDSVLRHQNRFKKRITRGGTAVAEQ